MQCTVMLSHVLASWTFVPTKKLAQNLTEPYRRLKYQIQIPQQYAPRVVYLLKVQRHGLWKRRLRGMVQIGFYSLDQPVEPMKLAHVGQACNERWVYRYVTDERYVSKLLQRNLYGLQR